MLTGTTGTTPRPALEGPSAFCWRQPPASKTIKTKATAEIAVRKDTAYLQKCFRDRLPFIISSTEVAHIPDAGQEWDGQGSVKRSNQAAESGRSTRRTPTFFTRRL